MTRSALWLYDELNNANENIRWQLELVEGTHHGGLVPTSFIHNLQFIFEKKE
ncbi:MAG: hypothetical protein AAFO82_09775 [Bacteroidota bacterium]